MAKNLVIVESPAKVKTVKKYLGSSYDVVASKGHVRDLPKSTLGIDVENDYEPKYITIRGKGDTLAELKRLAKEAKKVYLATDPDREGEAISWHLAQALNLDDGKKARITFNEITKPAVAASLKNSRDIDMNLVDAQQARRALDRLVGYGISPILWEKVKRGLSAGRVQSVALRMICDRDDEIDRFIPEEYWLLDALVSIHGEKKPIVARFFGTAYGKIDIHNKDELDQIMKQIDGKEMRIDEIKHSPREKKSPFPFVTSTLQQEASKALNFSTQKTMRIAQQLYESGHITYLRTDSVRVSDEALASAQAYIGANYGKEYVSYVKAPGKQGSKIQDAHEAIRPTDITVTPDQLKSKLDRDNFRLYQLIWKRFVASRMTNAKFEVTAINFCVSDYVFKATASKQTFDGFMRVYTSADDEKEEKNNVVSNLTDDAMIDGVQYDPSQHYTQPPAHFTEASLVKAMEEQGIGRPSTYSPTITTILARRYVRKEKKNLVVTELGKVVNDIMVTAFPDIVDITFTAKVEEKLDKIEEGEMEWKKVLREFYPGLKESIDEARSKLTRIKVKDEETDVICDKCGRNMVIKFGPHGKFLACPGFPECRNTMSIVEKAGAVCPKCGKELIIRKTKKGRRYYGCEGYPECDYMSWTKPGTKKSDKEEQVVIED
ncbi:MAG: type I DNA topoisomerase [Lachnospiraceae bacterium]|nr:type I DNA topoisomerase [Lachnospiraceae bacterium]